MLVDRRPKRQCSAHAAQRLLQYPDTRSCFLICFEQPWSMCPLLQPQLKALCDRGVQSLCECGPLEHSHWPVRRSAITAHDIQQPNDSPLPT